jgi:hypothetical protein
MKSGDCADVEAAELRSLLAQRHVHAGHFGQVLVFGGAGHLSPQVADWHDLKGDEDRYEHPDEWRSGHVRSSGKMLIGESQVRAEANNRTVLPEADRQAEISRR